MSPAMIVLSSEVRCVNAFVMSVSSVLWSAFVVSLGGMYMFARCRCLFLVRWIFMICSSVICVFRCVGMRMFVNVMDSCT